MYGSTEAGPVSSLASEDINGKPGSVGLPSFTVDVRVDASGEICVRSDFLMTGYFEDRVATSTALVDGWYHTGDLGIFDGEGYLSVIGRARDVIRTGGETVSPIEVEAVLAGLPGVGEVAVVGVSPPSSTPAASCSSTPFLVPARPRRFRGASSSRGFV